MTIQTEAGGLTAEEVEQRITIPIESAVNGLTGVKGVRSSSGGGLSFVWVDFDWSADPDVSRYRVFERLGQVRDFRLGRDHDDRPHVVRDERDGTRLA